MLVGDLIYELLLSSSHPPEVMLKFSRFRKSWIKIHYRTVSYHPKAPRFMDLNLEFTLPTYTGRYEFLYFDEEIIRIRIYTDFLRCEIPVKDCQRHGVEKEWYGDSQIKYTRCYVEGKKEGPQKRWYPNGVEAFSGSYLDGRQHGEHFGWFMNQVPKYIVTYYLGKLQGPYTLFFENGLVRKSLLF